MIPDFIDEGFANVLAAIAEGGDWSCVANTKVSSLWRLRIHGADDGVFPIHVWDLLKDEPFIGSKIGAAVRLVLQLLLIYTGWRIYTGNASQKDV